MKKLLLILIFTFSFQSLTKADDIRDFEIEGMSIGDSLLDYFSKEIIDNFDRDYYPASKKMHIKYIRSSKFKTYDTLTMSFKENDYKIYSITGSLWFDNFDTCNLKKDEIVEEITKSFNSKKLDQGTFKVPDLINDNSMKSQVEITLDDNSGLFSVQCVDWTKEVEDKNNWRDNLGVTVYSKDYELFLRNEAYK